MDPFTLALLGSTAASALSSGAGYAASQRAAGTQAQAAQQGGMLGFIAQQQALEEARRRTQQGVDASREFYRQGSGDVREFYGRGVGFQQPYMTTGAGATNRLASLFGQGGEYTQQPTYAQIQLDPAYEFLKQQGQQSMLNMARAGGTAGSGGALKAAERFGQGLASQEYGNAYNRFMANRAAVTQGLQNIAGTGANAAQISSNLAGQTGANLGTMASNTGNTIAGLYGGLASPQMTALAAANPYASAIENVGQARASGYMGGASALQGALQTPANAMLAYGMADRFAPQNRTSTYANQAGYLNGMPSYAAGFSPGFMGAPTAYRT